MFCKQISTMEAINGAIKVIDESEKVTRRTLVSLRRVKFTSEVAKKNELGRLGGHLN